MNMREYWANEAAAMRDTSGVLGKEVLTPVSVSPKRINNEKNVRTGYWLEGKKIVFSTFVYNATTKSDAEIKAFLNSAKTIQENFKGNGYTFEFKCEFVTEPRYDYKRTYRLYSGNNQKILKHKPKYADSGDGLLWIKDENELPCEYYMELFDQVRNAASDGGTHFHPLDKTESCYFAIFIPEALDNQRTLIHETLHPVLEHSIVGNNPIYAIYTSFFDTILKMRDDRDKSGMAILERDKEINRIIKANVVGLAEKATIIRENIMTTEAILLKSDNLKYYDLAYYLYDYGFPETKFKGFNSGTQIHLLQIESIAKQLKK
jgi:hypothetical protein